MKKAYVITPPDDLDDDELNDVIEHLTVDLGFRVTEDEHPGVHLIRLTRRGWTIAHPLAERLDGSLFECDAYWDEEDLGMYGTYELVRDEYDPSVWVLRGDALDEDTG